MPGLEYLGHGELRTAGSPNDPKTSSNLLEALLSVFPGEWGRSGRS